MAAGKVPESTDIIGSSCVGGHFPRDRHFSSVFQRGLWPWSYESCHVRLYTLFTAHP